MIAHELSSAETEKLYPYTTRVITRTHWKTSEHLEINVCLARLTNEHRCGYWNEITTYHFPRQEEAAALSDFMHFGGYHRLHRNSGQRSTREQVALEFMRLCRERQKIMSWARVERRLMEVVQAYRFERHAGNRSTPHEVAAKRVATLDPSVHEPKVYAGFILEWAEREHRAWFWRCCLRQHWL